MVPLFHTSTLRTLTQSCQLNLTTCLHTHSSLTLFSLSPFLTLFQSGEGLRPPELVCVRPSSSLREVLSLLTEHRLHRLHVIDDRQRPVGIVTITDLLRVIVGCNELLEALGPVSECTRGVSLFLFVCFDFECSGVTTVWWSQGAGERGKERGERGARWSSE